MTRTSTFTRRARLVAAGVLGVAVLLAGACGSDSSPSSETGAGDGAGSGSGPGAEGAGSGEAFPATIEHKYGETTIEAPPERIVTVGLTDHDALLALGITPVGVTEWFGGHPHGIWPWAQDELGDAQPEVVGDDATIGFERIAALQPDVILAVYAGLTDGDYETLSQIAPTVAQPGDYPNYGVPWDEQTTIIGEAVGRASQAEEAVAGVRARFDEARQAHPEFEGATALVASPYSDNVAVFAEHDTRGRFLAELGFEQPREVADLIGDDFSGDVSPERIDLLEVDALVWIVNDVDTDRAQFDEDPLYSQLAVHREGREAYVENLGEVGGALSFVSVLSLPVLLDQLVPQLATALAGSGAGGAAGSGGAAGGAGGGGG